MERRTKHYARKPEEYRIGRATKRASLLTWDELEDNRQVDMLKVAGKL